MYPDRDLERSVVEQVDGIGRVTPVTAQIKVLADRVVGLKRNELVEVGHRPFELDLELQVAHGPGAERLSRQLAPVDRLGILEHVKDERVLRRCRRIDGRLPGEYEVMRRYGLTVAPASFIAQPERRAVRAYVPALGDARRELVVDVVAEQAFHDMAENHAAHGIRQPRAVELRRLLGQRQRNGARLDIDRADRRRARTREIRRPGQGRHEKDESDSGCDREEGDLPDGHAAKRVSGWSGAWRVCGDPVGLLLGHWLCSLRPVVGLGYRGMATTDNRPPNLTTRTFSIRPPPRNRPCPNSAYRR